MSGRRLIVAVTGRYVDTKEQDPICRRNVLGRPLAKKLEPVRHFDIFRTDAPAREYVSCARCLGLNVDRVVLPSLQFC